MTSLSKTVIAKGLDKIIWDFKIGDNIVYNCRVLFSLENARHAARKNHGLFIKPIIICHVAIMEAIFYDLMRRLDEGAAHFPEQLKSKQQEIKLEIEKAKKVNKKGGGEKSLKDYTMRHYQEFLLKYAVFGGSNEKIYFELLDCAKLRARVHIQNKFRALPSDEAKVFTETERKTTEEILSHVLNEMVKRYPRPFGAKNNYTNWLKQLEDEATFV